MNPDKIKSILNVMSVYTLDDEILFMLVDLLTRENSEHVLHFESFKAYRTTFLLFTNDRVDLIFVSFLHRFLYLLVCLGRALVNGPPSF